MIKPDIIVSWPRNCDYPLWRQFIHDNRDRFNVVIVVFTETNQGEDYRAFIKEAMQKDWILFADAPQSPGKDWRTLAVNHGLIQSYNAPWVWFTEQDFLPNAGFWEAVEQYESLGVKAIGVKQGDRLHPCCLFLHRDIINSIKLDFSAKPPEYDHFGFIQQQLDGKINGSQMAMGLIGADKWQHMNGLSHNMTLVYNGDMPNYMPDEFNEYLRQTLKVTVGLDERYKKLVMEYFNRAGITA